MQRLPPRDSPLVWKRLHREIPCRARITEAVLVVDRERLGGFAKHVRRTALSRRAAATPPRPPGTVALGGTAPRRRAARRQRRPRHPFSEPVKDQAYAVGAVHATGAREARPRSGVHARSFVQPPEADRLTRGSDRRRPFLDELRGARGDQRERQQVEPVVLQHCSRAAARRRFGRSGNTATESRIRARRLRACGRTRSAPASSAGSSPALPPAPRLRHSRRAGWSMSRCGIPANGVAIRCTRSAFP